VLEAAEPEALDAGDEQGFTPLQLACFFGAPDAARRLLARGADPSSVSAGPPRTTPLLAALAGPNPELVPDLLAAGADVSGRGDGGFSPLHSAAAHGNAGAVRALLAAGADPSATNDAGATPADLARGAEVAALLPAR
jgi:ankyrin repeat protein